MKHKKTLSVLALVASCMVESNAQATLIDRGGGLLYDDVLKVTWLQDANYANTQMNWYTATNWVSELVFHDSVRNVDWSGWRLARNNPINGSSFYPYYAVDGSTDDGYNITSPNSELAYMYYVNLGLKGYYDIGNNPQLNYGIFNDGSTVGQKNVGLVKNLQSSIYWSGTNYGTPSYVAPVFYTYLGKQEYAYNKNGFNYAWAVRDGDVAPVPIPATIYLFGTGLLGLLRFKRHKLA